MTEVEAAKKWKSREDLLITRSHLCIGGGVYGIGVREEGGNCSAVIGFKSHRQCQEPSIIGTGICYCQGGVSGGNA